MDHRESVVEDQFEFVQRAALAGGPLALAPTAPTAHTVPFRKAPRRFAAAPAWHARLWVAAVCLHLSARSERLDMACELR
mmetsp:Transcript_19134/g.46932  ORF Transcript_19134/g.46932 Transcript_19134/m.46932 type:complete len:80 (+) Transcript_19134:146-385(+)